MDGDEMDPSKLIDDPTPIINKINDMEMPSKEWFLG